MLVPNLNAQHSNSWFWELNLNKGEIFLEQLLLAITHSRPVFKNLSILVGPYRVLIVCNIYPLFLACTVIIPCGHGVVRYQCWGHLAWRQGYKQM